MKILDINMNELVPSDYMRKIFDEEGFCFSDSQKATLVWNMPGRSWNEKLSLLRNIANCTDDAELQRQIMGRIEYEEETFRRYKENSDGRYVYVVEVDRSYSVGFFAEYEMARTYTLKYMMENEVVCDIKKQLIVKDNSDLMVKKVGRLNQYMFSRELEQEQMEEYDGFETSRITINQDGSIKYIYSSEMSREEELAVDEFNPDRFEFQFIKIPFMATSGAPVREVADQYAVDAFRAYGVLMNGTKEWEKYIRNIESKKWYVDFSDIQVEVCFLSEQGIWHHEHVNPLFLEIGEYPRNYDDEKEMAYALAIEAFSDYWTKEQIENGEYNEYLERRVIDTARNYRDICLKTRMDKEKKKSRWIDSAKTIYDIME